MTWRNIERVDPATPKADPLNTNVGCLGSLGLVLGAVGTGVAVSRAPELVYALGAILLALMFALVADKPAGVRSAVAQHKALVVGACIAVVIGVGPGYLVGSVNRAREQGRAAEAERVRVEAEKRALAAKEHEARLRNNAGPAAAKLSELTAALTLAIDQKRWADMARTLDHAKVTAGPYVDLAGLPPEMTAALAAFAPATENAESILRAQSAVPSALKNITDGKAQQSIGDYVSAYTWFDTAVDRLEAVKDPYQVYAPGAAKVLATAKRLRTQVRPKRDRQIAKQQEREQQAYQQRRLAELKAKACGTKAPLRSEWDGTYTAVEVYLTGIAHDPDSLEMVRCTDAVLTDKCWATQCAFRTRNIHGARVLETRRFYIANEHILVE